MVSIERLMLQLEDVVPENTLLTISNPDIVIAAIDPRIKLTIGDEVVVLGTFGNFVMVRQKKGDTEIDFPIGIEEDCIREFDTME